MIKQITWDEILAYWKANLWPNKAEVPMRAAVHPTGAQDHHIHSFECKFWGAYEGDQLVGVVSGFLTSAADYRMRGLDVLKANMGQGHFKALLVTVEQEGRSWGATRIWDVATDKHATQMATSGYAVIGDFTNHLGQNGNPLKVISKSLV